MTKFKVILMHKKVIFGRCFFVSVFVLVFLLYWVIYKNLPDISSQAAKDATETEQIESHARLQRLVTQENLGERLSIIIREFEDFDNLLPSTVESLQTVLGKVPIFVVADRLPYPPVTLKEGAQMVTLSTDLYRNYSSSCSLHFIKTQYVFIIPDGVRLSDWKQVESIVTYLYSQTSIKAVAVPVSTAKIKCQNLHVDLKRWSVSFYGNYSEIFDCPLVKGSHGLMMEADTLKSLSEPFARPFPLTFYIQAKLKNWKVRVATSARLDVLSELYQEPHSNWKHKKAEANRLRLFYESVGVKQEILATGVTRYYGCSKETARCFPTVINDMPDYLYLGKWTPPCCLRALRETAQHVFSVLEQSHVRYWLEGGSLLGAARHQDIIPWDYDVDIGIYKADVDKCLPLTRAREEKYIDEKLFVWEKAGEGDFYRVQYSETNHLHVDIYPFYPKNGIMTKDTWMLSHRQDMEFPERFLQPLTQIDFAGTVASAPNNVKEFLEYKFGEGVIEKPKYPNAHKPVI